jgi:hypothetical protein
MSAHLHTPNQPHPHRAAELANWVEDAAVALVCLCAAVIVAGILALVFII